MAQNVGQGEEKHTKLCACHEVNHFNEAVIHERQEVEVRRSTSMRRDPPMKSTRSNREISVLVTPATKTINFLSGSRSEEAERLEHAANKAGGPYRETN